MNIYRFPEFSQLNSDFQYKELTNDFDLNNALGKYRTDSSVIIASLKNKPSEIRNSGEATIDWYPANERNTYGIQVMCWTFVNTHMIFTRNKTENTWAEWVQYVTKSDLANKTKTGSATISTKQNDSTALQIQFDEPFPSRPYVTVSLNTDNANTNTKISVFGIDQTGFKVSIYDTAATTRRIEWIASV